MTKSRHTALIVGENAVTGAVRMSVAVSLGKGVGKLDGRNDQASAGRRAVHVCRQFAGAVGCKEDVLGLSWDAISTTTTQHKDNLKDNSSQQL